MVTVLLFHHALGRTPSFLDVADEIRQAGHTVHTPDLFDGRVFDDLDEGVAHADQLGFETVLELGAAAAEDLPSDVVYAGASLGALPAQALAQTRPGARGALLRFGGVPTSAFATPWPPDVPLRIHTKDDDPYTALDVVTELVEEAGGDLFLYPGSGHLFAEPGLEGYDEPATRLLLKRALEFLDRVG